MRITFLLKEILLARGEPERGLINRLAAATGLKRHQVAALLNNRIKHLPLESLGAVCEYLIQNKGIPRTDLPAILFALEPEKFWDLLSKRQFVEVCFGVRPDELAPDMIVAADSYLYGEVLKQLFGQQNHHRVVHKKSRDEEEPVAAETDTQADDADESPSPDESHPQARKSFEEEYSLKQRHVTAFGNSASDEEAIADAEAAYVEFNTHSVRRALVCLGSIKSNPVHEFPISQVFNAVAFKPQDTAKTPKHRSCPFFLRYRKRDAKAPSCYAGEILAKSHPETVPGIYYELPEGEWDVCKWSATEDAALIVYLNHKTTGVAEVAMGGFSSRSTHSLANALPDIAQDLWPPAIRDDDIEVGVFIVRFEYAPPADDDKNLELAAHRSVPFINHEVIPISKEAIDRHRKPSKSKTKK